MRKIVLLLLCGVLLIPLTGAQASDDIADAAVIINAKAETVKK